MVMCKKIFYYSDKINSCALFLESRLNYFTRKKDWFLVLVASNGERPVRVEKRISREAGESLARCLK